MPFDQIENFVRGNTDSSVTSTDTTISVVDATIFPDPTNGEYNLVFWDSDNHPRPDEDPDVEIVRVTGRDTTNNNLTVTRGQEATTAASHPSGSALQLGPTEKVFDDIDLLKVDVNGDTLGGNLNFGNNDLENARKVTGEDGIINGKTLESGDSMTIADDESMVVSESYTVNGTLTINGSGSLTVI